MLFCCLISNPLCYEGLSTLCLPFHSTLGHIFANFVAIFPFRPFNWTRFLQKCVCVRLPAPVLTHFSPECARFSLSASVCCREHKSGCVLFKNFCERKGLATAKAQMEPLKAPCSASCCSRWLGRKASGGATILLPQAVYTHPR